MDEDIYKLLQTAWEQNTIEGFFVHFQKSFHNAATSKTFKQATLLLSELRQHKIDSSFLICTHSKPQTPNGQAVSFKDTLKIPEKYALVAPRPHGGDSIFQHGGGTHDIQRDAYEHFQKKTKPVFVGSGLFGDACFRGAVTDLLNRTTNSNCIVALDAVYGINTERENIPKCMREKLAQFEIDQSRLHFTSVKEIVGALEQIVIEYQQDSVNHNLA